MVNRKVNRFKHKDTFISQCKSIRKLENWTLGSFQIISIIYVYVYIYNINLHFGISKSKAISQNQSSNKDTKVASPPLWNSKINVDDAAVITEIIFQRHQWVLDFYFLQNSLKRIILNSLWNQFGSHFENISYLENNFQMVSLYNFQNLITNFKRNPRIRILKFLVWNTIRFQKSKLYKSFLYKHI